VHGGPAVYTVATPAGCRGGRADADDSHPRRARSRLDGRYHLTRSSGRGPAPVTIARGSRYSLSAIGGERDDDPAEPGTAPALTAQLPEFASARHRWTHAAGPGSSLFGFFSPSLPAPPPRPGPGSTSGREPRGKNKNANAPAPRRPLSFAVLRFPCLLAVVSAWVAACSRDPTNCRTMFSR
jgi:hypothetical protein